MLTYIYTHNSNKRNNTLRALKNLTPSYNDSVENFKKIYKKCLGSSSTATEVKLMLNQFQFADGATTDEKFDAIKVMISTIAKNKADDSTSEDEEVDNSGKPKVSGITTTKAHECPYCAGNTWDKTVQANAGNCPGKNEVYTGLGRDGRAKLMSKNCPRLLNRKSNNQNGNSRGKGKFGNGNSGNDRNKGNGKFKGNCHECGQWDGGHVGSPNTI